MSREIVINLELTGRCNRRCCVCPQGEPDFPIVRKDMPPDDLRQVLARVREAADDGLFVREIICAGYGETFIHERLVESMEMIAGFKADFARDFGGRRPDVSIVTNGTPADERGLEAALGAVDILKFSFPTSDPAHYGRIMYRNEAEGPRLLALAEGSLRRYMAAFRDGRIRELRVHISPPVRQAHDDFPKTLEYLTGLARETGLGELRLVTFPSTSNRAGTIADDGFLNDFYRRQIRDLDGREVGGVRIVMLSELRVFYPRTSDVISVLRDPFPCVWKAGSLSIDASGNYRYCINDAASTVTLGHIREDRIAAVHRTLRSSGPGANCAGCNQNPAHMGDDLVQRLYSAAARVRIRMSRPRRTPSHRAARTPGTIVEGRAPAAGPGGDAP